MHLMVEIEFQSGYVPLEKETLPVHWSTPKDTDGRSSINSFNGLRSVSASEWIEAYLAFSEFYK